MGADSVVDDVFYLWRAESRPLPLAQDHHDIAPRLIQAQDELCGRCCRAHLRGHHQHHVRAGSRDIFDRAIHHAQALARVRRGRRRRQERGI